MNSRNGDNMGVNRSDFIRTCSKKLVPGFKMGTSFLGVILISGNQIMAKILFFLINCSSGWTEAF